MNVSRFPTVWRLIGRLMCGFGIGASLLSGAAATAATPSEARVWLDRMSHAFRERDYAGTFTYEHGDTLHSLQIVHAVQDGVERERLTHLDGPPREVIRRGHEVTCIHPGDSLMRLDHAVPAGPFAQQFFGDLEQLPAGYALRMGGAERVAGRPAVVLHLRARDAWRFHHRLVLDKATGLLLKSEILDQDGGLLERFQFTELHVGPVDEAALAPTTDGHRVAHHHRPVSPGSSETVPGDWRLAWVPPAFMLAMAEGSRHATEAAGGVRLYTDGLAVFSVFVEPAPDTGEPAMMMRHGATVVLSEDRRTPDHRVWRVTVVGEIPEATARRLLAAVTLGGNTP